MPADLSSVIAATAQWLLRAYPPERGALSGALAEAQCRQAATVAAWLRYPTALDAGLLDVTGPGGSGRLDWVTGVHAVPGEDAGWRTWVDEVVASWAACLLADRGLAVAAIATVTGSVHTAGLAPDFRRLTDPDRRDRQAAVLLRHPDLLSPVADLHRADLLTRLGSGTAQAA
ncbi:hypothetical protein [Amycolatopsis granulosa]|uniref:hypothetical protein n=1 Tax=Amycolatopsis granulosa TaxID=185684 RepID=UPI001423ABC5|nr:hypothetical protein [Amycolatopsis granulosa]